MDGRYNDMCDRELMVAFYHGDEKAFGVIADRWRPRLHGFFRARGFSAEDAEDLTEDTFVRLFLTKEKLSFDLSQPLEPFLFTVARNLGIQEWRHRKPEPELVPLLEDLDVSTAVTSVAGDVIGDLFQCIWRLPEKQRCYILLCGKHGLGELSHSEIAQVLGVWSPQVTQISQQTRANLRQWMADKGYR